ncbi:heavy-metal-associated domain-containing protein [Azospirillum sp.]|uniref:heavy-metal-associated domain-containing protein n=1 Tax=Azospirillum sp. TaxID=34012 RepID=UPI003D72915F
MSETYKVDGMTCGGCVRSVTNAITKLAPNATVAVDLPTGIVTVDGADADTVKNAVEGAGFDFGGKAA